MNPKIAKCVTTILRCNLFSKLAYLVTLLIFRLYLHIDLNSKLETISSFNLHKMYLFKKENKSKACIILKQSIRQILNFHGCLNTHGIMTQMELF